MAKRNNPDQNHTQPNDPAPIRELNAASTDLGFSEGDALRVEDVMQILHLSKNTVYKLAREGALPSYRIGRQMRFNYNDVRKALEQQGVLSSQNSSEPPQINNLFQPSAQPSYLQTPDILDKPPTWTTGALYIGGQDMSGDLLANYAAGLGIKTLRSHDNAYVSLARMYMGTCHAAILDLWSEQEKRYSTPYLRTMLPGISAIVFRLCKRRIGFTVAARNPLAIKSWADLLKPSVSLANRESGSGPRILLDEKLKYLEARNNSITGYDRIATSEFAASLLVARNMANVAVTSEKPFRQIKNLDFIPMQDECIDLCILKTPQTTPFIKAARSLLRTDAFRREFDPTLFDVSLMGEVIYEC
ncbi:MAG: helix-turn-helix transcriptional regulator [Coriobacteriales bacterium]|nr:helix-turn-helix transcriptional regulator [Coriobacteriales bacterium]